MADLKKAIDLANKGKFTEALIILEKLFSIVPDDPEVLYNLGMCHTELGNPKKAIELLEKVSNRSPFFSNVYVALGFAYAKINKLDKAESNFRIALELDPNNPFASRNLGGLFGKKGEHEEAIDLFINALLQHPDDMRTVYGLGLAYFKTKKLDEADNQLKIVIKNSNDLNLLELAKDLRRKIAEINLKSDGFRIDAMFYCLGAIEYFKNYKIKDVQKISFEIALKGQSGLDVNNPNKKYNLNSMAGEFSGLQLVCYMYVGFKTFAPEQDIGMDFSEEYNMAKKLFK